MFYFLSIDVRAFGVILGCKLTEKLDLNHTNDQIHAITLQLECARNRTGVDPSFLFDFTTTAATAGGPSCSQHI